MNFKNDSSREPYTCMKIAKSEDILILKNDEDSGSHRPYRHLADLTWSYFSSNRYNQYLKYYFLLSIT